MQISEAQSSQGNDTLLSFSGMQLKSKHYSAFV